MERPLAPVEAITGAVLLIVIFYDLFQSVVLPRPAVRKVQLARTIIRPLWGLWKWALNRGSRIDRSEARLAACAPLAPLSLLPVRGIGLPNGYASLVVWAG